MFCMKFLLILGAILFQSLALSEVVYINYADTEKMTIIIKNRIIEKDVSDFRLALADLKKKKKKLHMNAFNIQFLPPHGPCELRLVESSRAAMARLQTLVGEFW